MNWVFYNIPKNKFAEARESLGFLPEFLSSFDPRPAKEQFNEKYSHGGGWRPLEGWTYDPRTNRIKYPGDFPLVPIAGTALRGEVIFVYDYARVCIVQLDGTYEVARMD